MNESDATNTGKPKGRKLLWGGLLALIASVTIFGAITHAAPEHFGPFGAMHGEFNPERASKHIKKAVDWVLEDADASNDQKAKVNDIMQAALQDLLPLHQQMADAHQQIAQLMSQATIDRAALEKIRVSQMALMDTASKRLTQAFEDAADVLTPEQRQKLIAEHQRRRQEHHAGSAGG
jgi:periplasmic protein CpxP/Spy